ncbi:MAG: hypothetical protein GYA12_04940, partial [Chloroflexi bacterium]|nr:hypothetical protein [Chloroflexota bacterium]
MKIRQKRTTIPLIVFLIVSLLSSPGFSSTSTVTAKSLIQETVPTEPVTQDPLEQDFPTPTLVPTEIPTEVPTEIPTEIPTE